MKKVFAAALFSLVCGSALSAPAPITVANVATLQAGSFTSYPTIQLLGYYTAGDGGEGELNWVSNSTATVDGCLVYSTAGTPGTGRWIRDRHGAPLPLTACGAKPDGSTINTVALQAAFNTGVPISCYSNGTFLTGALIIQTNFTGATGIQTPPFTFRGASGCIIKFTSSAALGISTKNFGVRSSGVEPTVQVYNLDIAGLTLDESAMPQVVGNSALALEDVIFAHITNLKVIDTNGVGTLLWGLRLGRGDNQMIFDGDNIVPYPYIQSVGTVSGVNNDDASIHFSGFNSFQMNITHGAAVTIEHSIFNTFSDKIICHNAHDISIGRGTDFEFSGYVFNSPDNSCSAIFMDGTNTYGGFLGRMFNGNAIPIGSVINDLSSQAGGLPLVSLARSGTTASFCLPTTTQAPFGIFTYWVPPVKVGSYPVKITVSGDTTMGSVMNGTFIVATSDAVSNCGTYSVPDSGPTTSSGSPIMAAGSDGRFISSLNGSWSYDNIGGGAYPTGRIVLPNEETLSGFATDGVTEVMLATVDNLGRPSFGGGNLIINNQNVQNTVNGNGFAVTSADGTKNCILSVSNAGAIQCKP